MILDRARWPILAFAGALALLAGLGLGTVMIAPRDLWTGLAEGHGEAAVIVRQLRLPRTLLAFLVGGTLALSGAALQALVRNPLADPFLLGQAGGAGLGAVAAIGFGWGGALGVPVAAFVGAMAALGLVYRLSVVAGRRLDPRVLLLAGVVVGAFAGALMSAIIVLSDASRLRNAFLWLLGGLGGASWSTLGIFAAYAAVPTALLLAHGRALDLLALGEETAQHLGAEVERSRRLVYVTTGLLTAAGVAACGVIGFVGLVVPHAVRRLWGPLHRPLMPSAFLLGGTFLVLADVVARVTVPPLELPVGVVTALVGVPLFALLLRRSLA